MNSSKGEQFQKRLIQEVAKRREIWSKRTIKTKITVWEEIQKILDFPAQKLQIMWMSLFKEYSNILLSKTIERDNSPSDWPFFHDMTFMYHNARRGIIRKMGGLQPPLLLPKSSRTHGSCPCCLRPDELDQSKTQQVSRRRISNVQLHRQRTEIIKMIRDCPALYSRDDTYDNATAQMEWKRIAKTQGFSADVLKNRWRLYKERYLKELMQEKQSNGKYKSSWPNFKDMSFMRKHMQEDIDELETIRVNVESLVNVIKNTKEQGSQDE